MVRGRSMARRIDGGECMRVGLFHTFFEVSFEASCFPCLYHFVWLYMA